MSWFMVYTTVAVATLSVIGAWCAKSLRHDPSRLAAVIVAAVLWPVLVVGLAQFGAIQLYVAFLRRHRPAPVPVQQAPVDPEPATTPVVLLDSLARIAQQVGAKHPA